MTPPRSLVLHVDEGRGLAVQVRKETVLRSAHTGRSLQELHGWIVTSDEALHERLAASLPELGDLPVRAEDEAGDFAGKWSVSWNSYGESAGVHTYTLILREVEELSLDALLIDGLELRPYEYREEVLGEGLVIWAKVVGTEEDVLRLRTLVLDHSGFTVVRRGIQDEPREMRLGVAEWSPFEDRVKYRLVLLDQGLDPGVRPDLARIEEENGRSAFGFYACFFERVTELLVAKGLLTAEELEEVRDAARRDPGVKRHELWRVTDVDEL